MSKLDKDDIRTSRTPGLPPEYIQAVIDIDVEFFKKVTNCTTDEAARIALHKMRANLPQAKRWQRRRSAKWLKKRRLSPTILPVTKH